MNTIFIYEHVLNNLVDVELWSQTLLYDRTWEPKVYIGVDDYQWFEELCVYNQ